MGTHAAVAHPQSPLQFILHRRFLCTWQLEEHHTLGCRLGCGCRKETVEHWGTCPALDETRRKLSDLTDEPRFKSSLTFLIGETPIGELERGAANLWLILWHTLILAMIGRTAEGTAIHLDKVWNWTIRKYADLAFATAHTADVIRNRHISRGLDPPTEYPKQNKILAPLATIDPEKMERELVALDLLGYITHDNTSTTRPPIKGIKFVKKPCNTGET